MSESQPGGEMTFRGIAAAPGIARARLLLIGNPHPHIPQFQVNPDQIPHELDRLHQALAQTRADLESIQKRVAASLGKQDAEIFEAHLLVLEDAVLLDEIRRAIADTHINAEAAVSNVIQRYAAALQEVDDEYLRERAADVRDIGHRLIRRLTGATENLDLHHLDHPVILAAHDLAPSQTALIDRTKIVGLVTETGGPASHTSILARKLGIPAIVAVPHLVAATRGGESALLDGHSGTLVLHPTDQTLFEYGQLQERRVELDERLARLHSEPAVTLDGHRLILAANIEEPADLAAARNSGAEGVGLFRTEFLFLKPGPPPSEETQYLAYRAVAEGCHPHPAVIRTLDLGGDKLFPGHEHSEPNPFLGWRAIRICLDRHELFQTQLRAILRASAHGTVRILFPMISCVDELLHAIHITRACIHDLAQAGIPHDPEIKIGVMIEIPSAALIACHLATHADFFSIGTNDLTGYTLAVDRLNERVARLYTPTHPAVLQLIQTTVLAAASQHRPVAVCGETAGDPLLAPLLVGLGIDELSVTPSALPRIKYLLRRLRHTEAKSLAHTALQASTASETLANCQAFVHSIAPDLVSQGR